jgi:hypothetical protein
MRNRPNERSDPMSTSSGNPPVGVGYGFRHDDPDTPAEERNGSEQKDARDRFGTLDRELPNEPMDPEQKAEEIVVREQGVNSFSHAEEVDNMEQPPSVRDQEPEGNIVGDTIRGAWNALADDDTDGKRR